MFQNLFQTFWKIPVLNFLQQILCLIPQIFHQFLHAFRYQFLLCLFPCRKAFKFQGIEKRFVFCESLRLFQVLCRRFFLFQKPQIKARPVRFSCKVSCLREKFGCLLYLLADFFLHRLHPGSFFQFLCRFYIISLSAGVQPFLRIGVAHGKTVKLPYHFRYFLICFPGREIVRKKAEFLILRRTVRLFHDFICHVGLQKPHFSLVSHTKGRV